MVISWIISSFLYSHVYSIGYELHFKTLYCPAVIIRSSYINCHIKQSNLSIFIIFQYPHTSFMQPSVPFIFSKHQNKNLDFQTPTIFRFDPCTFA